MEALVRERRPLRKLFQKYEGEVLELLGAEVPDLHTIQVRFGAVKQTFQRLTEVDRKFLDFMLTNQVTPEAEDEEHEGQASFAMRLESLRLKVESLTQNRSSVSTASVSEFGANGGQENGLQNYRQIQIPMVQIPKFSGHLKDWIRYWAQFEKIDQHPQLTGSDKLVYLLQSLEPNTDAYKIVSRFPPSSENYVVAVEALKKKFANPDRLLEVYVRELLGVVISNFTSKDKIPLKDLFLNVDTQIRALRTLNLEKADPSTWLFPLVEACLPSDILHQWKRKAKRNEDIHTEENPKNRLDILLEFMENEVDIGDEMEVTKSFTEKSAAQEPRESGKRKLTSASSKTPIPTLATFHAGDMKQKEKCVFCGLTNHHSRNCLKAKRLTLFERKEVLKKQFRCFICFDRHHSKQCNDKQIKCSSCGGRHYWLMCERDLHRKKSGPPQKRPRTEQDVTENTINSSNQICTSAVALQTVKVRVAHGEEEKTVRVFLDPGSHRSYILKQTANELRLQPASVERVVHSLFGGRLTNPTTHEVFEVDLSDLNGEFKLKMKVRDQKQLCSRIPSFGENQPVLVQEMKTNGVNLSDDGGDTEPIEMLIGNDFYGRILTGNIINMDCGLTAIQTKFGWTLSGEIETIESSTAVYMDLMVSDATITQLWDLETIGIENPEERLKVKEEQEIVKRRFVEGMKKNEDGRFVVNLPWKVGHPALASNKEVALKRLKTTVQKLKQNGLLKEYGKLFSDWEKEGFIARVIGSSVQGHYIPHRPVIKRESSTTPVRPVFDASCKTFRSVSLNDCLEKGPNLLQEIPDILMRFRLKKVAFVADIRKAFQMMGIAEQDRDSLRFLWCRGGDLEDLIEYRHGRVMFGATSSPFILGAVIEHYLKTLPELNRKFGEELWNSLYVDNCVASVDCRADYLDFRSKAVELLQQIQMDLRLWFSNVDEDMMDPITPVLGLLWNRASDSLSLKLEKFVAPTVVTKRSILSSLAKIYDPIGFSCPAVMPLKLIMQRTWIQKLKWDEALPAAEEKLFLKWIADFDYLKRIEVPRCATDGERDSNQWTLHVFSDASSSAFAAVAYLRVKAADKVVVHLFSAKARVSPLKKMTIPRLELLSCVLGTRLAMAVKRGIKMENITTTLWSDSTTALAWIFRKEPWATWVGNRVKEIRQFTNLEQWKHIPGCHNPADLPSRGCSPKQLFESKWWLGPDWMKLEEKDWPSSVREINEEMVFSERRRMEIHRTLTSFCNFNLPEQFHKDHGFNAQIRIIGWMKRFLFNAIHEKTERRRGELTTTEIEAAEITVWKMVQDDYFSGDQRDQLKGLEIIEDGNGLLRVKTRLTFRDDTHDFKYPVLVPGKSSLVKRMIHDLHLKNLHAGVGFLMCQIREKYWIPHARKTIRGITTKCLRCRRFSAKSLITPTAPLPSDRISDSEVYQTVGVDLAGPLHVKGGKKVWIVIFTCAVYRAVYLTVVGSLSSVAFIMALKRFIEKYRRPETIYCDNGTNFHGAANYFKKLDWRRITKEEGISPITFKHSPPISAWWGGWWERMIGTAKSLMKRTVGNATLNRSELEVMLRDITHIMNGRPLTYVSEDPRDLEPLTPAHFLNPLGKASFPEGEIAEAEKLRLRWQYLKKLKEELRGRFRKEYLALLVSKQPKKTDRKLQVGELVIVGSDTKKRLQWPLARVLEIMPGKDGVPRVARVKTAEGEFIRTVQRLFPLEMDFDANESKEVVKVFRTRSGRVVKQPERLGVKT